jgi:hypothetical protein
MEVLSKNASTPIEVNPVIETSARVTREEPVFKSDAVNVPDPLITVEIQSVVAGDVNNAWSVPNVTAGLTAAAVAGHMKTVVKLAHPWKVLVPMLVTGVGTIKEAITVSPKA